LRQFTFQNRSGERKSLARPVRREYHLAHWESAGQRDRPGLTNRIGEISYNPAIFYLANYYPRG
jgi:hypothetical protein